MRNLITWILVACLAITAVNAINVDVLDMTCYGDEHNDTFVQAVERGERFHNSIEITALEDLYNVDIYARIIGYEHGQISYTHETIDLKANVTYIKKFWFDLPENMPVDTYAVRYYIADRDSPSTICYINRAVEAKRHLLRFKDVVLSPEVGVEPNRALLTKVRVWNAGQKDEKNIRLQIEVPDLGISASSYIDEVESGDTLTTEELYLKIPKCAEPGAYWAKITMTYHEGDYVAWTDLPVKVLEGDEELCALANPDEEIVVLNTLPPLVTETQQKEEPVQTKNVNFALEVGLIALVVILVIVGLIIGYYQYREE
ncbi:hypothetical protein ACFLZX_02430 [Nanoarchaeota archaeon]